MAKRKNKQTKTRTHQQGNLSQFTLLSSPRDGDDVTFARNKLGLDTDVTIFLCWSILTCKLTREQNSNKTVAKGTV